MDSFDLEDEGAPFPRNAGHCLACDILLNLRRHEYLVRLLWEPRIHSFIVCVRALVSVRYTLMLCCGNHFGSWCKGIMTVCYSSHKIIDFKLVVMVCLVFRGKTMQWISRLCEVWYSEYRVMITFCMGCSSFEIHNKMQVFQKLLYWDYGYIWGKHHLLQELYVQSPIRRNWQWLLTIGK
jgi:hypothetical protein